MKLEVVSTSDIFSLLKSGDALTVPTNGMVKVDGSLVMGAGFAKQMNDKTNGELAKYLGTKVLSEGNIVHYAGMYKGVYLFSFPTKSDWKNNSDIKLIEKSAIRLYSMLSDNDKINKIYMPFPGIGKGNLREDVVLEVLENILDTRFILVKKCIDR